MRFHSAFADASVFKAESCTINCPALTTAGAGAGTATVDSFGGDGGATGSNDGAKTTGTFAAAVGVGAGAGGGAAGSLFVTSAFKGSGGAGSTMFFLGKSVV